MQVTHERLSILAIYRITSDYDSQSRDSSLQLYLQSTYGGARGIRTLTGWILSPQSPSIGLPLHI